MKRQENPTSRQSSVRRNRGSANSGFPIAVSVLCALLLLAIVGWVFWTHSNAPGKQSILSASLQSISHPHGDQHKPSAGKPAATPQAPAQASVSPKPAPAPLILSSSAIPGSSAISGSSAVSTPVPLAPSPAFVPRRDLPAERKGLRNGCKSGTLSLTPDTVAFACPGDNAKSVSISRATVGGPDDDGIETIGHEKYHFKIEGMSKDATRILFAEWFRAAPSYDHPAK